MKRPKRFSPARPEFSREKFSFNRYEETGTKNPLYNRKWATYSKEFLRVNTKCYACGKRSEATDHLIPHKNDLVLFNKPDNHIPLCHSCHSYVTNYFDKRPNERSTQRKLKWLALMREKHEVTVRVKVLPRGPLDSSR